MRIKRAFAVAFLIGLAHSFDNWIFFSHVAIAQEESDSSDDSSDGDQSPPSDNDDDGPSTEVRDSPLPPPDAYPDTGDSIPLPEKRPSPGDD